MGFHFEWINSFEGEIKCEVTFENGNKIIVDFKDLFDYLDQQDEDSDFYIAPENLGVEIKKRKLTRGIEGCEDDD